MFGLWSVSLNGICMNRQICNKNCVNQIYLTFFGSGQAACGPGAGGHGDGEGFGDAKAQEV